MSSISKGCKQDGKTKFKTFGDHDKFINRIRKTLYYGKLPLTERLSLPTTEIATELFSEAHYGRSLNRLHCDTAAKISREACVSPCSLVLAMLYLERLKTCNPDYLKRTTPSELFLVSLMISSKFLHDDGEEDEVFISEWAKSGGLEIQELRCLEMDFLNAIDWKVYIQESIFWSRLTKLETQVALRQGNLRGWFSYTDMQNALNTVDFNVLLQFLFKLYSVLMVSYVASVVTLLGSVYVASHVPGTSLHTARCAQLQSNNFSTTVSNEQIIMPSIDDDLSTSAENGTTIEIDVTKMPNQFQKNTVAIDAVNVLTTGFILASIKTSSNYKSDEFENETDIDHHENKSQDVTWDWWNIDVMNWLYNNSNFNDDVRINEFFIGKKCFDYGKRIDMSIANCKYLDLEDQVHKASSTRIQDQIESSWHKEWTDSILHVFFATDFLEFLKTAPY